MRVSERRKGQEGAALAEYALLIAGVVLASLVAVSVLGTKVGGLVSSVAFLLPGAHPELNAPITAGTLMETRVDDVNGDGSTEIVVDASRIADELSDTPRLGTALGLDAHDASHLYQQGSKPNPFHQ
jgi:Flp pilus assembly pilin Flp